MHGHFQRAVRQLQVCHRVAQRSAPYASSQDRTTLIGRAVPSASSISMPSQKANREDFCSLVDKVQAFIFDCDGVLWKGDSLIEGVPETLDMLRSMGKKMIFVTNNSTKSRKGYQSKFASMGLPVSPEEIYSSSYAAAAFLEFTGLPKHKKVYVIGEAGIPEELELLGYEHLGGPADAGKVPSMGKGERLEVDREVGAVVVGFDRHINYYKIQYATVCLREVPGCRFIATNLDATAHLTDAQVWAAGGSMVGAIKGATQREPTVAGKPNTFMLDDIATKFKLSPDQICMVGDRLDTDVMFGKQGGLTTLLVLSGVTTEQELLSEGNSIQPDYYTDRLPDLLNCKVHE